jgi:flagellar hook protein FlgE
MSFNGLFSIGLSGLSAYSTGLEAVSSNIANSQTNGYKRLSTMFSDLLSVNAPAFNTAIGAGVVGTGVAAVTRQLVGEQGAVTRTDAPTNLAVLGDGLFVISREPGAASSETLFTRAGEFRIDALGNLVNAGGYYLKGAAGAGSGFTGLQGLSTINVNALPPGRTAAELGALTSVAIDAAGVLTATYANGESHALYRIPLAIFTNADGLEEAEAAAFRESTLSGRPAISAAQSGGAGALEGGAVEISTVDIGQEFSTLISTQRAYSTNARIISTADALWRTLVETAA